MSVERLFSFPLKGLNLIEASAGTGKTYTISALVLRLLLEEDGDISRILVVTFSEAAAADLRRQIREKIRLAHLAFVEPEREEKDEFISRLRKNCADKARAARRLAAALQGFDEAAIYTIHGFCLRVLQENSLAGKILFDACLTPDSRPLIRQVGEDFFRRRFYDCVYDYAAAIGDVFVPEKLEDLMTGVTIREGDEILPPHDPEAGPRLLGLIKKLELALKRLRRSWQACRDEVGDLLCKAITAGELNGVSYKIAGIEEWFAVVDDICAASGVDLVRKKGGMPAQLSATVLAKKTNKGRQTPQHDFFVLAGEMIELQEAAVAARESLVVDLAAGFLRRAGREIAGIRGQRGELGFDDLLFNLAQALAGDGGCLAGVIRERYPRAFIDEFQDTDYLQFAIFRAIYHGRNEALLYLIGDPKQSIYGFRGADLKVYLAARALADCCFPLDRNYRSTPALVAAVNRVFMRPENPFLLREIGPFPEARSAAVVSDVLTVAGDSDAVMRIVLCHRSADLVEKGRALTNDVGETMVCDWLVAEIRRLIAAGGKGAATIGPHPLAAGDIAVLVRNNRHAHLVQKRLAAAGVASVLFSGESVFAGREARDLLIVLTAVSRPLDQRCFRAALLTLFFGLSVDELVALDGEGGELDRWRQRFYDWNHLWQTQGVLRLLRVMARQCGLKRRLAALPLGERRLTNFFHLAEVLEKRSGRGRAGVSACLRVLGEEIAAPGRDEDETQLRLESDARCVQIITMHKSKGLQYPVVFCPFLWWGRQGRRAGADDLPRPLRVHPGADSAPGVDLGSPDYETRRREAEVEELAESIRLCYVALTRAVHRCYMFWGAMGTSPGTCAPAYLFHQHLADSWPVTGRGAARLIVDLGEDGIKADLAALAGDRGDIEVIEAHARSVSAAAVEDDAPAAALACRSISREIGVAWRNTSFSAISEHSACSPPSSPAVAAAIDAFPRGARSGLFFHRILEDLDFADSSGWDAIVRGHLRGYGFDGRWEEPVRRMLDRLIHLALGAEGVSLARVGRDKRWSEFEFLFPCDFRAADLAAVFAAAGRDWSRDFSARVARLSSERIAGFMKGFIDLVFARGGRYYIVDWKSNYLGNGAGAYRGDNLTASMVAEGYILQYHLYVVALDRFLGSRMDDYDYGRHFGGVFYPYLRGVAHGCGVFADRPEEELVRRLGEKLSLTVR